jgi:hypothetical protein
MAMLDFELGGPDLVYPWLDFYHGTNMGAGSPLGLLRATTNVSKFSQKP